LGYPFSVSEEFQKRNTNATIEESLGRVEAMQHLCVKNNKELVVYLSMGFGNPYGEEWNSEIVYKWCNVLFEKFDIRIQALSDTIGAANPSLVESLFKEIIPALPNVEIGAHLHTRPENAQSIVAAAFKAGCKRFDGALKGLGGCPMAKDDLTGNMPTEVMLDWFEQNSVSTGINHEFLGKALQESKMVFPL
jgi:hydroxymethylglutaryl-CoA lyase